MSWSSNQLKKLKYPLLSLSLFFGAAAGANAAATDLVQRKPVRTTAPMPKQISKVFNINDGDDLPSGKLQTTMLHQYIEDGDYATLKQYLDAGYDPDSPGKNNKTPMMTLFESWNQLKDNPHRADMFRLLVAHGADLTGKKTIYNESAIDIAFKEFKHYVFGATMDNVEAIRLLMETKYDIVGYIHSKPDALLSAFTIALGQADNIRSNNFILRGTNDAHLAMIALLLSDGLDINRITSSATKANLGHAAAAYNNMVLLHMLEQKGFKGWKAETAAGATAADYAMAHGAEAAKEWLAQKGVSSNIEMVAGIAIADNFSALAKRFPYGTLITPPMDKKERDVYFSMFPKLEKPKYDNGKKPVAVVTEHTLLGAIFAPYHMHDTHRTVNGTTQRLLDGTSLTQLIAFDSNPVELDKTFEHLLSGYDNPSVYLQGLILNQGTQTGDIIYSQSIGLNFRDRPESVVKGYYQSSYPASKEYNKFFMDLNPIIHKSNGNNEDDSCVGFGPKKELTVCLRSGDPFWFSARSVYVGAAQKLFNDDWMVHYYSDDQPAYCSPLPLDKYGLVYRGTSFSAPSSAAIEADLMENHGRTDAFAPGVIHEDIILALMLTADRDNIVDERTGRKPISFTRENAAGIKLSDRCGAGVIRADKADNLLREMVAIAKSNYAKPSILEDIEVAVDTARPAVRETGVFTSGTEYVYEITIPKTGAVTKPFIVLDFEREKKGAAVMISPRGTTSVVRPGLNGNTDDDSFWGETWNKGEKLTIVTTAPLPTDGTYAKIRMTAPDSVFAYTAKYWRLMLNQTLYNRTDFGPPGVKPGHDPDPQP